MIIFSHNAPLTSLKRLASVEVASSLWSDKKELMYKTFLKVTPLSFVEAKKYVRQEMFYCGKLKEWKQVESSVINNAQLLPLPETLKTQLFSLIKYMGLQIFWWLLVHCKWYHKIIMPRRFYCISNGNVNYQRMAKMLVEDESLDIDKRYWLACTYCLEDKIISLWKEVRGFGDMKEKMMSGDSLVSFWSHKMEGQLVEFDDRMRRYSGKDDVKSYFFAFEKAVCSGQLDATIYFFGKVNKEISPENFLKIVECMFQMINYKNFNLGNHSEVFCFLISQVDEARKTLVLGRHAKHILEFLLECRCKNVLLKIVDGVCSYISVDEYIGILYKISSRPGYSENCKEVFQKLWNGSPFPYKSYVIGNCSKCCRTPSLILDLFRFAKDADSIRLILKAATPIQRRNIVFAHVAQRFGNSTLCDERWACIRFLIKEISLPNVEMLSFKNELKMRLSQIEPQCMVPRFDSFFQ